MLNLFSSENRARSVTRVTVGEKVRRERRWTSAGETPALGTGEILAFGDGLSGQHRA